MAITTRDGLIAAQATAQRLRILKSLMFDDEPVWSAIVDSDLYEAVVNVVVPDAAVAYHCAYHRQRDA